MNESPSRATHNIGRGVLLIGPGRYFGMEILHRFALEGFSIGVISRTAERIEHLRSHLQLPSSLNLSAEVADVTQEAELKLAVNRVAESIGSVDCLIYNPKVSISGSGLTTSPDELRYSLDVNVVGALVAVQAALPYLQLASRPCVILTGGGFKDRPDFERFALSVGKSGIHAVSRALVGPLTSRGIRIKTIVIDGYVRAGGQIEPSDVADYFWRVFTSQKRQVFRYSSSSNSGDQLPFPDFCE
jgi:NADP-dependent 3-hydroxy acid dehydrogenase YdfG